MSYDIELKARIGKSNRFVNMGNFNITYNLGEIIKKSSGYDKWSGNFETTAQEIYPYFVNGLIQLKRHKSDYKIYEPSNGWGNLENVIQMYNWFFDVVEGLSKEDLKDIYFEVY